jgi:hypothetical protein
MHPANMLQLVIDQQPADPLAREMVHYAATAFGTRRVRRNDGRDERCCMTCIPGIRKMRMVGRRSKRVGAR